MDSHDLKQLLESVRDGRLSPEQAAHHIRIRPFQEAGEFAKVDLHRGMRCGFPEVVFGQGKTAPQIEGILHTLVAHGEGALVTRLDPQAAVHLVKAFPDGEHNAGGPHLPDSRQARRGAQAGQGRSSSRPARATCRSPRKPESPPRPGTATCRWSPTSASPGCIACCTSSTASQRADALVVVAGMEGALPSVVGGLVDCPVIAVPTSIGYGAHFHGVAALLGMLNSCASNVVVVNIDAGFSGGHVASLIARRMGQARQSAQPPAALDRDRDSTGSHSRTEYAGRSPRISRRPQGIEEHMTLEAIEAVPVLGPRPRDSHKGRFGHVLVIAGSRGMAGAAALCGAGALRSGAGPGARRDAGGSPAHGGELRALVHDLSLALRPGRLHSLRRGADRPSSD